jgi:RNA polymerase sigma factor for flagellar operon FliA
MIVDPTKQHDIAEYWRLYKTEGDQRARDQLILAYSPLVKYVAGRMSSGLPAHIEEGDLVSYGLLGLIGALERFDPSRSIKFETYAISRIKGSIIDELRALDWVPRSVRSWARKVEASITKLENQLTRAPTDDEIAADLGLGVDDFQDILNQISCSWARTRSTSSTRSRTPRPRIPPRPIASRRSRRS